MEFKAGEKGSFLTYGTNHPMDNGLRPWLSQTVFRFDDLSSISVKMAGNYDPASHMTKGSGEIIGGNIEADWAGTYSLPAVSRGLEQ